MTSPQCERDQQLEQMIEARLHAELQRASAEIRVTVDGGVVTLDGVVASNSRRMAVRQAAFAAGSVVIADELRDGGEAPLAWAPKRDTDIAIALNDALAVGQHGAGDFIVACVRHARVLLGGYVRSDQRRAVVEDVAIHLPGVVGIDSMIHVESSMASATS